MAARVAAIHESAIARKDSCRRRRASRGCPGLGPGM